MSVRFLLKDEWKRNVIKSFYYESLSVPFSHQSPLVRGTKKIKNITGNNKWGIIYIDIKNNSYTFSLLSLLKVLHLLKWR